MKYYKGFLIICSILLIACVRTEPINKSQSDKIVSINQSMRDISQIKAEVRKGNIQSYNELSIIYLDYPRENFLFWALLMANKYDYTLAYLDVFYILCESNGVSIENFHLLDSRTQKIALEYLTIPSERGIEQANEMLQHLNVEPSEELREND